MLARLQMASKEIPSHGKDISKLRFDQNKVGLLGGPVVTDEFQAKYNSGLEKAKVSKTPPVDPRQFVMEELFK